ncbi:hypothetical protein ONZ43_g3134 [Nemania bipapillata]|uniref:Uncharacterized protein n=1 Tax=Nemania bipapillata TaxID=110536 RepID=A0ACC2IXW1_9PEZI|nr:hypothetical protein ONZ43_g3134 [Nemania bipapillata]
MAVMKQAALFGLLAATAASAIHISIDSKGGNVTGGFHYGLLHEDIDNSGDGGLYAELIRNRAFQSSKGYESSLDGWYPVNGENLSLSTSGVPLSQALSTSMNVATGSTQGQVGFFNDGYWGMDVKVQTYHGSFWVRGDYSGYFTASLQSNITGERFGLARVKSQSRAHEWVEHEFTLTPTKNAPNSNNTFAITFDAGAMKSASLDFNLISLFPPTFKGRKNGMRIDIVEALEEFHPSLFRLPGGNMLEGSSNASWWNWKDSIGPLKDRPAFAGVWGYQQTNGLGLLEYLEFAEDLGMDLVLAVYAGLSLNGDVTPKDQLQQFIDNAMDEIEFIRGPPDSKWGAVRAKLGHPEPWKLEYVEIGNEDWLAGAPSDPDIQVISSGSVYDGYDIPSPGAGDYHLYAEPDRWISEFGLFDNVETPHLIGEMASTFPNGGTGWGSGVLRPFPWWGGAVGEAVALISYERNADRIIGALYAPILRNMNRWQWSITMLQFAADPAMTTRSTSWYAWELLAAHPITETLPASADINPLYYVAGKNEKTQAHVFKAAVYNSTNGASVPVSLTFDGMAVGTTAELTVLTGPEDPYEVNNPFTGVNIVKTAKTTVKSDNNGTFSFSLPNLSIALAFGVQPTRELRNMTEEHDSTTELESAESGQHQTLKYHLLGPSLTKAGQDSVDQSKVSEIIYNASKGSKFFNREEAKDKVLTQKIEQILTKKRRLEKLDLTRESRAADQLIAELEASRDLTQRIVHIDCDAFYAAVEQLDRPELRDVPFAVGGGVLTTCNYVARKFGCRSGMAGFVAKKLCPELLLIRPNFEKYATKAHEVRDILANYDPRFESASIDEAYLNITEYCTHHNMSADEAVQQMRDEIHAKTKITVSAGIAANAKLAKICSNFNKPNGQYSLPNDREAIMTFMHDLSTRKVNGIGRVLERELQEIGIRTCGEIHPHRQLLRQLFGEKIYQFLLECYLGLGRTQVQPAEEYERKSVGTESTFRDISDAAELREKLRWTARELEKDMQKAECKGRTLVLKVKLHTYEVFTRQVVLPRAMYQADDLYQYSLPILTKLQTESEYP